MIMNGLTTAPASPLEWCSRSAVHKNFILMHNKKNVSKTIEIHLKPRDKIQSHKQHVTIKIQIHTKHITSKSQTPVANELPVKQSAHPRPLNKLVPSGKNDFNFFLKSSMSSSLLISFGRRFHDLGATCEMLYLRNCSTPSFPPACYFVGMWSSSTLIGRPWVPFHEDSCG